jgi:opine dehydrogenase
LDKPIAVLGGGAAAQTIAAHLTLKGFDINLWEHPSFEKKFKPILEKGTIECKGLVEGIAKLHKVTTNLIEAVENVNLINIAIPALGHEVFFDDLIPHLKDGQIVIVWSGDAGSLRLAKKLKDIAPDKNILIAETHTMPYGTRVIEAGEVNILVLAKKICLAALPAKDTEKIVSMAEELYPNIIPADNVLAISLSNPNPTVHPPGSVLNVGRIEYSKGEFYMYREGITAATARVVRALYDETLAVAKAFGFNILEYEDEDFRNTGTIMGVEFWAPFDKLGIIADIKGPSNLDDRYIIEDLPYGLVHRSQLGDLVGVPTPIIDGIINIGAVVCETDFWKGRTLKDLGLAGMTKEEIMKYLQEGK